MSALKKRFVELYESADSIEVDGFFTRYYDNEINIEEKDISANIVNLNVGDDNGKMEVFISIDDLENISLDEEGNKWTVAGLVFEFYNLENISSNPSIATDLC
ncbi:hypothetical protein A3715_10650 [Oleiphilus sp. HI0009]|nr:hypothetical protein A3715_10650 [Oleiphilus sp. HI0009]